MKKLLVFILSIILTVIILPLNNINSKAVSQPMIVVDQVRGASGDTVDVNVSLVNNPGIVAFRFSFEYDDTVLELTNITKGLFNGMVSSPVANKPITLVWDDSAAPSNNTSNGVVATFTFKIIDTAQDCNSPITVSYNPNNVFNWDFENVNFGVEHGGVTVVNQKEFYEGIFTYEKRNEKVAITVCDTSATGDIVIPSTLGGCSVTEIRNNAFKDCSNITSVQIPVSVTQIGASLFDGCDKLKTILYDGSDSKWNQIDINTDLTQVKIVCLGNVRFSGASLTIYDNFALSYKIKKSYIDNGDLTNIYAVFEIGERTIKIEEYIEKDDMYVFVFEDIAPDKMNETIIATLYGTYNGTEYVTSVKEYSIAQYCCNMLEKYASDENSKFRTLLVDMLNYGAMAQNYTGYQKDNLCNALLTSNQKDWATSNIPTIKNDKNLEYKVIDNPTVSWNGAWLELDDSIRINFMLNTQSIEGLTVKIKSGNSAWNYSENDFKLTDDGKYYINFDKLNASQMRQKVYATVYCNDIEVSNTICYSSQSYAYEKIFGDQKLSDLLVAMIKYGDAAYAYVN